MKKTILIFSILARTLISFGQIIQNNSLSKTDSSNSTRVTGFNFYYPNGVKYNGNAKTIGELNKELEEKGRVHLHLYSSDSTLILVGFKLFTNVPLWIEISDSSLIDKAIKSFNLSTFFELDFKRLLITNINDKVLTKDFIIKTLGSPKQKIPYTDNQLKMDNWVYDSLGITLKFNDNLLISFKDKTDTAFIDCKNYYRSSTELKNGRYYYLGKDYCRFGSKDTLNEKRFGGKEPSIFQVLYQQGNRAFIRFKTLETSHNLRPPTITLDDPEAKSCNCPLVNITDTFSTILSDFNISYHSEIYDESYCDYILKGQIRTGNLTYKQKSFILIIDEGFEQKDSLLLFTDKNGDYELAHNTMSGFICTTGKNRRAYNKLHKYIIFTFLIDNKTFKRRYRLNSVFWRKIKHYNIAY
jgi:hypothetical protein